MKVIGILNSGAPESPGEQFAAFHSGLREGGFVDGQNVTTLNRWAHDDYNKLAQCAADLVKLNVGVIVAAGGTISAQAARKATSSIPVVFTAVTSPDKSNLTGGNVTGVAGLTSELDPKRLDLLHKFKPGAKLIGVLANGNRPRVNDQIADLQQFAGTSSLTLEVQKATSESEIDTAFAAFAQKRVEALLVTADPCFNSQRSHVVVRATELAVPAIYQWSGFVAAGGLMSYGPRITDAYQKAGAYAARILAGARPADLPIVYPTRFDLVVHSQRAKEFVDKIPPEFFARACETPEGQPHAEITVVSAYTEEPTNFRGRL